MGQHYSRLTNADRKSIQHYWEKGYNCSQIGERLQRSPSTISRELRKTKAGKAYNANDAQKITESRYKRRDRKIHKNEELEQKIKDSLKLYWSPDQISRNLKMEYPDDETMQVSKETIYSYIYVLPRGELKKELIRCLRLHHKSRMPRSRGKSRKGQIQDMISIHERPKETEDRTIPGHWEGDFIMGKGNKSAIGTLVERTTRYTMLLHLASKDAESTRKAMARAVKNLPSTLKRSLTYDRGKEMSEHKLFTKDTKMKVYFADPCSPWQRGTNENTNGSSRLESSA